MSRNLKDLHNASDEDLIREHDDRAKHTSVGISYYIDELNRRSQERVESSMYELATKSHRLSIRVFWLSIVSTVVAIAALFVAIFIKQ